MEISLMLTLRRDESSDATETRFFPLPPEALHTAVGDTILHYGFHFTVDGRFWFGQTGDHRKMRLNITAAETDTTWKEIDTVASGHGRDAEDAGGES